MESTMAEVNSNSVTKSESTVVNNITEIVVSTINDVPFPIEAFLWMSEEGESAEAVFVLIFVSEALVKIVSVLFV
jgi:hypothetical protein